MKKLLFSIATLISFGTFAQPVLTANGLNPIHGDIFYGHYVDTFREGASGANVVWDLSVANEIGLDTAFIYSCDSTSDCGTVAGSNIVNMNAGDAMIMQSSSSALKILGFTSSGFSIELNDPSVLMKYPFNYLDRYVDTFDFYISSVGFRHTQIDSVIYDGYGILKLPVRTDSNVARIKIISHSIDSSMFDYTVSRTVTYNWYKNGFRNMLATLTYDTAGATEPYVSSAAYYVANKNKLGVTNVNEPLNGINIYPNPASDVINISLGEHLIASAGITITDLTGNVVYRNTLNSNDFSNGVLQINSQTFATGMYILKLETDKGTSIQKIVIQK